MPPKKTRSTLGCAAICFAYLCGPPLLALLATWINSASTGVGAMGWRSWFLLGVVLECVWLFPAFRAASLARRKREQAERAVVEERTKPSWRPRSGS